MANEVFEGLTKDERTALVKAIQLKQKREKHKKTKLSGTEKKEQIKRWTTFYRRNLDIYAEERLKIRLKPFQTIMLHLMGVSQVFFAICSRGLSKTFTVGLFAVCKCLLYPYTWVVITASSLDQGGKMVREKIRMELCGKLSPVLKWMYESGLIKITISRDNVKVEFWNGSYIQVLPPEETARGNRASILIFEECRLLKKHDIDSIFNPMMQPRQAQYLNLPLYQYADGTVKPQYIEEGISIYITSARYKIEWFWAMFKQCVVDMYCNSRVPYNVFAGDIFMAIKYGLKTRGDWSKIQATTNELDLRMEYLNEMIGEIENAYFTHQMFANCQKLSKAFYPPTSLEINMDRYKPFRVKTKNEVRILVVDFAMSNAVKGSEETDNTVIGCMSGLYHNKHIIRSLEYMETVGGGESEKTNQRIHELFWDYHADYIILDQRSGGEVYYNNLTKPFKHPQRSAEFWDSHGFSVSREDNIHFLKDSKVQDLIQRTVDKESINCVIPVIASPDFNSRMWQNLALTMRDNKLKLLVDDIEYKQQVETTQKYLQADSEERMRMLLPFVQTTFLVNEGINLKQKWTEGKLKLFEPRSGTKDRMVALCYGNEFFNTLENKLSKRDEEDDFSEDSWADLMVV